MKSSRSKRTLADNGHCDVINDVTVTLTVLSFESDRIVMNARAAIRSNAKMINLFYLCQEIKSEIEIFKLVWLYPG